MKSVRKDGRGHWPAGKPRSTLTRLEGQLVASIIRARVAKHGIRPVARELGCSDGTVRRIIAGLVRPSAATRDRVDQFVTQLETT